MSIVANKYDSVIDISNTGALYIRDPTFASGSPRITSPVDECWLRDICCLSISETFPLIIQIVDDTQHNLSVLRALTMHSHTATINIANNFDILLENDDVE